MSTPTTLGPKRVLVATDFSTSAQHALDYARVLAHATGAGVVLHHSLDLPDPHTMVGGALKAAPHLDEVTAKATAALEAEAKRAQLGQMLLTTDIGRHRAESEIVQAAERHGCDLIVVGTRGHSGVKRFVLGSVSSRVARSSPVAVLVVPPHSELPE